MSQWQSEKGGAPVRRRKQQLGVCGRRGWRWGWKGWCEGPCEGFGLLQILRQMVRPVFGVFDTGVNVET